MTGALDDVNDPGGGAVGAESGGQGAATPEPDLEPGQALHEEFDRLTRHPVGEAQRLHEVEQLGYSGSTPWIALARTAAFVILPAFLIMAGIAISVYYLA